MILLKILGRITKEKLSVPHSVKVAIDIRHLTTPNPSGVGYYTLHLIDELARISPETSFFLFATGTKKTLENLPSFERENVKTCKRKIPNKIFKILMKLPGGPTMEDFLPEKVDAWLFPDSNIIRTKLPYLITAHDLSFETFKQFFTASQIWRHRIAGTRKLFERAAGILAVSHSTKNDIELIYQIPSDRIFVTELGVTEEFHPRMLPSDQNFLRENNICNPYFLTLSTLEPRKNIESVIEAYDAWREKTEIQHPPKLVIAGGTGWKTTSISQTLIDAKYREDIKLIGYVNQKHKPALLRNAKAFFFPSFYEGFGLPALEAMASGTPVVTTFTGSLPEVVGDAAIMIDPYNVRDLEQAFNLLEDQELKNVLISRGIERAKAFSWDQTAKKTVHAINAVIST